eukprot:211587-Rhodomonas_salina.2
MPQPAHRQQQPPRSAPHPIPVPASVLACRCLTWDLAERAHDASLAPPFPTSVPDILSPTTRTASWPRAPSASRNTA